MVNMFPVLLVHFLGGFALSGISITTFYQNMLMFILQDLPTRLQFQLPYFHIY